ncbi:hypothetical protein Cob_v002843 [Colletotrichum orbiculare MAFF 240422]|uniref:Uncharacterized protein n=1 Tax=Colletotrichum orbiculare (strain 104-T / ATCC 96160 / CBS 514.97 / LARS 414 / MAFF 240422) TaxID=1213857 RepID=A0A484G1M1_COLOR|nr:hypothetical protein Cob_v002843 [Colletotrichum orbiculare MAFF 240422]
MRSCQSGWHRVTLLRLAPIEHAALGLDVPKPGYIGVDSERVFLVVALLDCEKPAINHKKRDRKGDVDHMLEAWPLAPP